MEGMVWRSSESGVIGSNKVLVVGIKEGVKADHILGHVVGPFKDLRADVDKEGIGGPPTKDHDFGRGMVIKEKGHCCTGSNRFGANFMGVVTKGRFPAINHADAAQ